MAMDLVVRSRADSPELKKAASSIEQAAWNELGYLNYTRAHYEHYSDLLDSYPEYQLCLVDQKTGYPVGAANCVPFACSGSDELPPEGWDWIVETAFRTKGKKRVNMLGALAISIPKIHRSKGYARLLIHALQELAEKKGLRGVVAPVRPSSKAEHPWVSIDDYVTWTDEKGRIFDPWLRSHLAAGGKLVGPCKRSMVVEEPIAFWENWTKSKFETSGAYVLDGGLVPVEIDVERQTGRYAEPNVWVTYAV
jgi:GNAT superfamily N-acetyltransferase